MKRTIVTRPFPAKPVGPPKNPQAEEIVQLIEKIKLAIESQKNSEATSTETSPEIITVEVEGTLVEMTRAGYEIWKSRLTLRVTQS